MSDELRGILNLDKPAGVTSRDVVNRVQRLARPAKVGHAGTLDPLATGVLVVCVGRTTRLIQYVQRQPKSYRATFLMGRSSPTDDIEGPVTADPAASDPSSQPGKEALKRAAGALVGRIEQRPPAYSAVKVAGRRAYDLARRGKDVQLAPREVDVYRLDVVNYEYPRLELDIECGSGTYVRALGRDLAASLGTSAVMSALRRTAVGRFRVEEAIAPDHLDQETWVQQLQPARTAVADMPTLSLTAEQVAEVRAGKWLSLESVPANEGELAGVDPSGRLTAILVPRGSMAEQAEVASRWGPRVNL